MARLDAGRPSLDFSIGKSLTLKTNLPRGRCYSMGLVVRELCSSGFPHAQPFGILCLMKRECSRFPLRLRPRQQSSAPQFSRSTLRMPPKPSPRTFPLSHYLWLLNRDKWKLAAFVVVVVASTIIVSSRLTHLLRIDRNHRCRPPDADRGHRSGRSFQPRIGK